jgi:hypothetical protein
MILEEMSRTQAGETEVEGLRSGVVERFSKQGASGKSCERR